MSIIQIKNRWTNAVIWEGEAVSLMDAVLKAKAADANLSEADLSGADLSEADLSGADLRGADLSGAYLSGANLLAIKADFFEILLRAPREIPGLVNALKSGAVSGSTYTGECCCLVGTVAKVRGCEYTQLKGISPDSSRPAERWFLAIQKGNTPESSPVAKITLEWIEEFLLLLADAISPVAPAESI